jgi:isopenicillin-N epimerase
MPTNPLRRHWTLDPEITFLNHGSFGACPRVVLEKQSEWRARLEAEPVRFFVRELFKEIENVREILGRFIGADPEELVRVPNATSGVNTVLRSLDFSPGDELLVTDHEYNACRNILDFVAQKSGARVVVAKAPFPCKSADEINDAILGAVTQKTKFALIDHITSQTGVIFPVEKIVPELRRRNIETMIDGAHAPGMLHLDLTALGEVYYTGNCHKWMCTPKGAAFLRVPKSRQHLIRPLTISHGANATLRGGTTRFRAEFEWTGTDDPTAFLCIPDAMKFMGEIAGSWEALRAANHDLVVRARKILCAAAGTEAPCPESMLGSMAAFRIKDCKPGEDPEHFDIDPVIDALFKRGFELPVNVWPKAPTRYLRVSAQIYNSIDEYERLAVALREVSA